MRKRVRRIVCTFCNVIITKRSAYCKILSQMCQPITYTNVSIRPQIRIPGVIVISDGICVFNWSDSAVWRLTDCRFTGFDLTTPPVVGTRIDDHYPYFVFPPKFRDFYI